MHDRTPPEGVTERIGNAEIAFTNKSLLPAEVIKALPSLQYIGVLATGYNVVDIDAAREQSIAVTNIPAYGTVSVAQMTFALILELTQQPALHDASVHARVTGPSAQIFVTGKNRLWSWTVSRWVLWAMARLVKR